MNETGTSSQGDLFQTLVADHQAIHELLRATRAATVAARDGLVPRLREAIEGHALAEEEILIPRLGETPGLEAHAAAVKDELARVRDCLELLGALTARDPAWETALRELEHAIDRHVDEEESRLFTSLRETLTADELTALGARFERARRTLGAVAA